MRFHPNPDAPLTLGSAALASAGLLALAMPGRIGWWPLLFVALVPLLLIALYARPGRSALAGFVFGLVYHLALLYWILIVLGRYGGLPLWVTLPALFLLSAYMACFPAIFCWLTSRVAGRSWHRERSVAPLIWGAPVLWVGLDFLRGLVLSGFPWMDLGYGLFSQPRLIQAADIGGHHLLTFSLVLANGLMVGIIDRQRRGVRWNVRLERWLLIAAVGFLVFIGGYSLVRYQVVGAIAARSMQARVAVVQGNIDQAIKWSPATKAATVDTYLRLSRQAIAGQDVELVVWPETALPFYPQRDALMQRVSDLATSNNTWLLTGAPLYQLPRQAGAGESVRYYNGAILIGPEGRLGGQYAKQHLVPFGEYVPLRRFLPFLEPLVVSIGDFTAGDQRGPLRLGPLQLGMLVCYESIFPAIAHESVIRGANLLVNITNDAWYGRSSAPHQSMAMAVLRAVENKRTLIRAANTGISGFVDPTGRIVAQSDIFTEAALSESAPMLDLATVFNRGGHRFGAACALFLPLMLLHRLRRVE
ncbi:apolipoprotein N-acyltransferase [Desulfobulbus propionicus DSM 2032]|uniref:Apolipoprotein N-acyltransferase n=1 Tax=Desulfobulbus propionicus (strain ATCC 33891 / DSM 2032 / VKM B-1956 / 1pr3) TaxID=577650 RepID=A0A7U3YPH2_DESPD|nr:apolipoprotein N-acyltransferase [Desulfobulbus propionicus]ADW19173.1 apolipoprotein N-acyltransferase [Desulfobulbus propionicus DSM 2032]